MRSCKSNKSLRILVLFFICNITRAQYWEREGNVQAELLVGAAGYSGDLSDAEFHFPSLRPTINLNLNYQLSTRFVLRGGLAWAKVIGNDKYNKPELKSRNLNFQSHLFEANLCLEVNILTPDLFNSYPYVFAGVGLFHFNPYTIDKAGKKVFLKPLSTEGQGLEEYPDKKPYSLFQLCLPVGGGIKKILNEKYEVAFEFGYRKLFTDYLDDVSTTYVDDQTLLTKRGAKAVELAYGHNPLPHSAGEIRGNPKKKDWYYFAGFKVLVTLGEVGGY